MNVKWLKMKVSFAHFIGKVKSAAGNQLQWKSSRSSRGRNVVAVSCTTHSITPGGAQDPILKSSSGNVTHAGQMIGPVVFTSLNQQVIQLFHFLCVKYKHHRLLFHTGFNNWFLVVIQCNTMLTNN